MTRDNKNDDPSTATIPYIIIIIESVTDPMMDLNVHILDCTFDKSKWKT